MNPEILSVKQATRLGPGNTPVAVLMVEWKAGTYGPFSLQSTWEDLNSGKLMDNLRTQTRLLDGLPKAQQTA